MQLDHFKIGNHFAILHSSRTFSNLLQNNTTISQPRRMSNILSALHQYYQYPVHFILQCWIGRYHEPSTELCNVFCYKFWHMHSTLSTKTLKILAPLLFCYIICLKNISFCITKVYQHFTRYVLLLMYILFPITNKGFKSERISMYLHWIYLHENCTFMCFIKVFIIFMFDNCKHML